MPRMQKSVLPGGIGTVVVTGAIGGILAGSVLGLVFSSESLLGQIAVIYGFDNTATDIGWIVHLAHSLLFGLVFVATLRLGIISKFSNQTAEKMPWNRKTNSDNIIGRVIPNQRSTTIVLGGVLYGSIVWLIVFSGIFVELLHRRAGMYFMERVGGLMTVETLILHIVYGLILGVGVVIVSSVLLRMRN